MRAILPTLMLTKVTYCIPKVCLLYSTYMFLVLYTVVHIIYIYNLMVKHVTYYYGLINQQSAHLSCCLQDYSAHMMKVSLSIYSLVSFVPIPICIG